jgi:type I restriction enzyme R subunit
MVQIFVAMTPEQTLYFANPGEADKFSEQFYFHWADRNNDVVHEWHKVATDLLSIPMAHQLIGYYTIADDKDKTLKVLRSYQYFAASRISDVVHQTNWDDHQHRGGYVWHTTGSGKTMTSFKSAQLISESGDADKVVFLLDRIELGVQSLDEYRGFAGNPDDINDTADTRILLNKLESPDTDGTLIVTSIQKMANIATSNNIDENTLKKIGNKRLVFRALLVFEIFWDIKQVAARDRKITLLCLERATARKTYAQGVIASRIRAHTRALLSAYLKNAQKLDRRGAFRG